ncbi:trypsin-like peptidase domain-containing protein [Clostridium gasigenes]|uniref:S1C family serine protease n=1 Tax=Clostridium gasigenes TaxID=94869 RepID=UPI0014386A3A|nr:trypsin-like peptidase domain-containing protein [Clostridium gasigenes]MBU3132751.1 trypsin-like peptidase domain-containing protein [Clostridium gasigenes]NKF06442.1 trypsin-like serine protease [Clostridium gasigenes]QSW20320.1 trypsin-like peptidase domain-containing protein [Clostridium gasigenes]
MDDNKEIYDVDDFQHVDTEKNDSRYLDNIKSEEVYDNREINMEYENSSRIEEEISSEEKSKKNKKTRVKKNRGGFKIIALIISCSLLSGIVGSTATYILFKKNILQSNTKNINNGPTTFDIDTTVLTPTEAFERVAPAVVVVSSKSIKEYGGFLPTEEVEGIGSGFIISEEGYILTNYHVIEGSKDVTVTLSDKREVKAKVINYDKNQDVAMLKIIDEIKVPAVVELGDSEALKPGEELIAIGTPLSKEFSQTVTKGIVSAVNRTVQTSQGVNSNFIQTDTPINPGNSGGPLVNNKGQVIGINARKIDGKDLKVEGMGFAIPINEVRGRIEALSKPIMELGITLRAVDKDTAKQNELEEGLYIINVVEYSSAEKAGLIPRDLITKFDGKRIKTFDELKAIKDTKNVGDTVKIEIIRDKKEMTVDLTLSDK